MKQSLLRCVGSTFYNVIILANLFNKKLTFLNCKPFENIN